MLTIIPPDNFEEIYFTPITYRPKINESKIPFEISINNLTQQHAKNYQQKKLLDLSKRLEYVGKIIKTQIKYPQFDWEFIKNNFR